jgi:hypothetical protein
MAGPHQRIENQSFASPVNNYITHREIAIRDFPIRHIACGPPRSPWRTGVRSTEEVRNRQESGYCPSGNRIS